MWSSTIDFKSILQLIFVIYTVAEPCFSDARFLRIADHALEVVRSIFKAKQLDQGRMSLKEAKEALMEYVQDVRYGALCCIAMQE